MHRSRVEQNSDHPPNMKLLQLILTVSDFEIYTSAIIETQ